jgi:hypothetical protein
VLLKMLMSVSLKGNWFSRFEALLDDDSKIHGDWTRDGRGGTDPECMDRAHLQARSMPTTRLQREREETMNMKMRITYDDNHTVGFNEFSSVDHVVHAAGLA